MAMVSSEMGRRGMSKRKAKLTDEAVPTAISRLMPAPNVPAS